jgi:uncharacterized protein
MWTELLTALALVFVIEGIMPFINPAGMRRVMLMASQLNDGTLRGIGLVSMLIGIVLLYVVR